MDDQPQAREAQPAPPPAPGPSLMDRYGEVLFVVGVMVIIFAIHLIKVRWRRFMGRDSSYDL